MLNAKRHVNNVLVNVEININ